MYLFSPGVTNHNHLRRGGAPAGPGTPPPPRRPSRLADRPASTTAPPRRPHATPARPDDRPPLHLDHQRDRPVVDQLDIHVRAEAPPPRAAPLAKPLIQDPRVLPRRSRHVAGPVASPRVAVQRELAH